MICTGPESLFPAPAPFSSSSLSRVRFLTCPTAMLVAVIAAESVAGSESPPPFALNASHAIPTAERRDFILVAPAAAPPPRQPLASAGLLGTLPGRDFPSRLAFGRGTVPETFPAATGNFFKDGPTMTGVWFLCASERSSSPAAVDGEKRSVFAAGGG